MEASTPLSDAPHVYFTVLLVFVTSLLILCIPAYYSAVIT
jgi:hypothetical protein